MFGAEADRTRINQSSSASDAEDETSLQSFFNNGFTETGDITDGADTTLDWIATLRAKAGYSSGRTLIYGTGGVAYAKGKYTARNNDVDPIIPDFGDNGTLNVKDIGIVAGAGIEHLVSRRFSVRVEALYHHFGKKADTSQLTTDSSVGDLFAIDDVVIARLGATFRPFIAADYDNTVIVPENWTGFTIGGHGGFSEIDFDSAFDSGEIDNPFDLHRTVIGRQFELDGFTGGLHAGYDKAIGRFVVGLEGDITKYGKSGRAFDPSAGPPTSPVEDSASIDIDWLASLRARVDILSENTLFYATGGIAYAIATYKAASNDTSFASARKVSLDGFGVVMGAGIEHQLNDRLRVRLEGLSYQMNLNRNTVNLTPESDAGDFANFKSSATIRAGVTLRLGG